MKFSSPLFSRVETFSSTSETFALQLESARVRATQRAVALLQESPQTRAAYLESIQINNDLGRQTPPLQPNQPEVQPANQGIKKYRTPILTGVAKDDRFVCAWHRALLELLSAGLSCSKLTQRVQP
jgi:hypothetical protein